MLPGFPRAVTLWSKETPMGRVRRLGSWLTLVDRIGLCGVLALTGCPLADLKGGVLTCDSGCFSPWVCVDGQCQPDGGDLSSAGTTSRGSGFESTSGVVT